MRLRLVVVSIGCCLLTGIASPAAEQPAKNPASSNLSSSSKTNSSTSKPKPPAPIPKIIRGPYLQLGTPSNVVLRWRTDIPGPSKVRYGTNRMSLRQRASANGDASEHVVLLNQLLPDTRYYYSIETNPPPPASTNKTTASNLTASASATTNVATNTPSDRTVVGIEKWSFRTAPIPGRARPFRAWVLGDPGTKRSGQFAVRDAYYKFSDDKNTDLWLMLGDNAYTAGKDKEYQDSVFAVYQEMFQKSVLWPALGNHDGGSANSATQSGVYYDIFTLPTLAQAGGVMSGTEAYYSYDFANAHFICLDSHDSDRSTNGAMARWLRQDLAATRQDWVLAYFHHPPFTKGSHDSDDDKDSEGRMRDMRQNILPILEAGGADLVLTGHSHVYERSYLLRGHFGKSATFLSSMILDGGSSRPDRGSLYRKGSLGTIYLVAGSSGQTNKPTLKTNTPATASNLVAAVEASVPGLKAGASSEKGKTAPTPVLRPSRTSAKGAYQLRPEPEDEEEEIDDEKEKIARGEKPPSSERGKLNHPAMCFSTNALGSLVLDVDGLRLQGTFLNEKGTVVDRFTVFKTRAGRR